MTRVSTAAAVTLQTWSRTVLAKKEASSLRYEKQMEQLKAKSLESSERVSMEVLAQRFLMVAACVALVGVTTTQAAGGPQILASSPMQGSSSPAKIFQAVVGSISPFLFSRKG